MPHHKHYGKSNHKSFTDDKIRKVIMPYHDYLVSVETNNMLINCTKELLRHTSEENQKHLIC